MSEASELLRAFRYKVSLTCAEAPTKDKTLGEGGFSECSGLSMDADVKDILQGGINDRVTRLVGRVKLVPLVLKRGMFIPGVQQPDDKSPAAPKPDEKKVAASELWDWFSDTIGGVLPVRRYNGTVTVTGPTGERDLAMWKFVRGLPVKISGPTLDARTGEVAIEELHIAHEGIWLVNPGRGRP